MTALLVLAIVVVAIAMFSVESIPIEVTSLTVVALLALSGALTPAEAFAGFSNDTVIFIFTLLAMTQGLASTGVVQMIGQKLTFFARFGHQTFILALMLVVAGFSSIVSNTVTTAAFLPVAIGAAARANVPKSKVLLPMAYASMLGGTIFLYGTSTNLVTSAAMQGFGLRGLSLAELAPVAVPLAIVGIALVVLLGPRLLPNREEMANASGYQLRDYLTEAVLTQDSPYVGQELREITEGLGLRVLGLVRNGSALPANPSHVLTAVDRLIIEGQRSDILRVKDLRGVEIRPDLKLSDEQLRPRDTLLVEASVPPGSMLVGRTLKETLFSERFGLVALAIHRRPAIQRLTKLQLLGRVWGGHSLSTIPLSVGDVLLLRGSRRRVSELADASTLLMLTDVEYQPPRYARALIAVVVFVGALLLGSTGVLPLSVAGLVGMLLMIASGCVDARLAFRVDWRVVLLIGSMMSLGIAMQKSGAATLLGELISQTSGFAGVHGVLAALMVLTILLSAPMSNQAAALVVLPIALNAAQNMGVDPRTFAIGIALAASCSFITPLEPSCVLVYGPGHYRFTDFFRLGTPLTVVALLLLTVAVPFVWPFDGAGSHETAEMGGLTGTKESPPAPVLPMLEQLTP